MENYKHFENKKCEFYPCHNLDKINCLFCFCPLYHRQDCGGEYIGVGLLKDCARCILPHNEDGYSFVTDKLNHIQ